MFVRMNRSSSFWISGSLFSRLADTVSPLVRQLKSSCSVQENGDNERPIVNRRRPSVLDEKALREADTKLIRDQRIQAISRSYQGILESIGEDPTRQGKTREWVVIGIRRWKFHCRPFKNIETCC